MVHLTVATNRISKIQVHLRQEVLNRSMRFQDEIPRQAMFRQLRLLAALVNKRNLKGEAVIINHRSLRHQTITPEATTSSAFSTMIQTQQLMEGK